MAPMIPIIVPVLSSTFGIDVDVGVDVDVDVGVDVDTGIDIDADVGFNFGCDVVMLVGGIC